MEQITPITATFTWTFDEFKARNAALTVRNVPPNRSSAFTTWLTYGCLLVAMIWMVTKHVSNWGSPLFDPTRINWSSIGLFILPPTIMVIVIWVVLKQNPKRAFSYSPDRDKSVMVTFTSDDILMKVPGLYETRWTWPALIEVRRTPNGFCFFVAPKGGFWVPFHAFQSNNDIEAVADMSRRLTPKFNVTIA
jgi:hypothetical protein